MFRVAKGMMSTQARSGLRRMVGGQDFYKEIAKIDRMNADKWTEMSNVQADFAAGEGAYGKEAMAYSESMRETLHHSVVNIVESRLLEEARGSSGGLYGYFVRLHPTAFKANGACTLGLKDMAAVMFNTRSTMMTPQHLAWLHQGFSEKYDVAQDAAEIVRQERASKGLPVTEDGYNKD